MKAIYMINSTCNTNCFHCYRGEAIKKDILQCEKDIKSLINQGHQIVVAGAEVLCEPQKLRLYQLVGQDYLLSNGIILTKNPSIIEKLHLHGIRKVILSWHIGFTELTKSIPEAITLRAIKNLQREKVALSINCVIGNKNFNRLEEMATRLIDQGVQEVKFLQLMPTNRRIIPYLLTTAQKEIFFQKVVSLRQRYSKDVLCVRLHANFNATLTRKAMVAKQEGSYCPAGKSLVVIETDNRIYPCPYMASVRFCMGELIEGQVIIRRNIENDGRGCCAATMQNYGGEN